MVRLDKRHGKRDKGRMIDISEDNLKQGVLGLVIALVEIIRDALKLQAVKRMEGGSLNEEEIERLGRALKELDVAIDSIKEEQGVGEAVRSVRDGLDDIVNDVIDRVIKPVSKVEEAPKSLARI